MSVPVLKRLAAFAVASCLVGSSTLAQNAPPVARLDHVYAQLSSPRDVRAGVAFLSDTLGLLVVFTPASNGARYGQSFYNGGLWTGNAMLEIISFAAEGSVGQAPAFWRGVAFEPRDQGILNSALRRSGIPHQHFTSEMTNAAGERVRHWTNTIIGAPFSSGRRTLFFTHFETPFVAEIRRRGDGPFEAPTYAALRAVWSQALPTAGRNGLGVCRLAAVHIFAPDSVSPSVLDALVGPRAPRDDAWRLPDEARLYWTSAGKLEEIRVELGVQSLDHAASHLRRTGISHRRNEASIEIDTEGALHRLPLILRQDACGRPAP